MLKPPKLKAWPREVKARRLSGNAVNVELRSTDNVWHARCLIAMELDKALSSVILCRNTSTQVLDDYDVLGNDDVTVTISDEGVVRELLKAIEKREDKSLVFDDLLDVKCLQVFDKGVFCRPF